MGLTILKKNKYSSKDSQNFYKSILNLRLLKKWLITFDITNKTDPFKLITTEELKKKKVFKNSGLWYVWNWKMQKGLRRNKMKKEGGQRERKNSSNPKVIIDILNLICIDLKRNIFFFIFWILFVCFFLDFQKSIRICSSFFKNIS